VNKQKCTVRLAHQPVRMRSRIIKRLRITSATGSTSCHFRTIYIRYRPASYEMRALSARDKNCCRSVEAQPVVSQSVSQSIARHISLLSNCYDVELTERCSRASVRLLIVICVLFSMCCCCWLSDVIMLLMLATSIVQTCVSIFYYVVDGPSY
jgi:hypothetical protein